MVRSKTSVVDPWNFGPDPDLRMRSTGSEIRIQPFSSVAFQMLPKMLFFSQSFLFFAFRRYMYIYHTVYKSSRITSQSVDIKVFLLFFAWWWKDPDPYK
jgi:hypothetical protein